MPLASLVTAVATDPERTAGMLSSHIKANQRPVQILNKASSIVVHEETAWDSRYLLRDPSSTQHRQSLYRAAALLVISKCAWV